MRRIERANRPERPQPHRRKPPCVPQRPISTAALGCTRPFPGGAMPATFSTGPNSCTPTTWSFYATLIPYGAAAAPSSSCS
jgi:hypothetical protein